MITSVPPHFSYSLPCVQMSKTASEFDCEKTLTDEQKIINQIENSYFEVSLFLLPSTIIEFIANSGLFKKINTDRRKRKKGTGRQGQILRRKGRNKGEMVDIYINRQMNNRKERQKDR